MSDSPISDEALRELLIMVNAWSSLAHSSVNILRQCIDLAKAKAAEPLSDDMDASNSAE